MSVPIKSSEGTTQPLIKLRSLGNLEHYCSTWNHIKYYLNVSQTATYTYPSSEPPLGTQLFTALASVIGTHPSLSCIPIGEDTNIPYFARLPEIDLKRAVTHLTRKTKYLGNADEKDEELDELLEEQHNTPFSGTTTPYWRLIVLENPWNEKTFTASFIYHHAIADGTSGIIFHRNLLAALNSPCLPYITRANANIKSPDWPLLPPIEDLINLRPGLRFIMKTWWNSAGHSRSKKLWTGSKILPPSRTNFRSISFAKDMTEKLVGVCRAKNTTVQAALQCIVAKELFGCLPPEVERLKVVIPVSLRRWCTGTVVQEGMGVWISSTEVVFRRKKLTLPWGALPWAQAKWGREVIDNYLETTGKNDNLGLLKYVKDFEGFCRGAIGTEREGSLEVSNVGRFDFGDEEDQDERKWRVGRMVFSQSAGVMSSAILVTVVTGGDGGLTLGFSWQDGCVEKEVVENLIKAADIFIRRKFNPPPPRDPNHFDLDEYLYGEDFRERLGLQPKQR